MERISIYKHTFSVPVTLIHNCEKFNTPKSEKMKIKQFKFKAKQNKITTSQCKSQGSRARGPHLIELLI